ncbi:MAG: hypothetical protein K6T92_02670 [Candidatus Rokubacteria bacterium]|nr:hypothetical protein [Candidatus Rokubacteria bacterium]
MSDLAELTCKLCGQERDVVQPEELAAADVGRGGQQMIAHLIFVHGMDGRTARFTVRDVLGYTRPSTPCPRCGGSGEVAETVMIARPVWLDGRPLGLALHQEIAWRTCWECGGSGEARTA